MNAVRRGSASITFAANDDSDVTRKLDTTARNIQQNLTEDFQLVLAHALVIDILYACCYTRIEPRARKYFDATRIVADREKR